MADVDMTDAPSGSSAPSKKVASKAKAGADGGADGKKRFEVKKVMRSFQQACHMVLI
jgi:RING-box protein 1